MFAKSRNSVWAEQQYDSEYSYLYDALQSRIKSLPDSCIYIAEAKAVLDNVKSVKENNLLKDPHSKKSILDTLALTVNLLASLQQIPVKPIVSSVLYVEQTNVNLGVDEIGSEEDFEDQKQVIIPPAVLEQLQKYDEFGRTLKSEAGLQILKGAIYALAATILLGIFFVLFALAPITIPLMGITSGLIFAVLATVGFCAVIPGAIGWAKSIITFINGASTINLANSMQGLLSKVQEHVNPTNAFTQGLELLETNKVREAAASFARVPVDDPNYVNAQGLIRIYRSDQSKTRGSPSKQNVLLLDPSYRAREAEREERRKLQMTEDQSGDQSKILEEDWRDVRDRLGVDSPQYARYLIDQNIKRQEAAGEFSIPAKGPR